MNEIVQRLHRKFYLVPLLLLVVDAALSLYEYLSGNGVKSRFTFFSLGITAGWLSFTTGIAALFNIRKNRLATGLFFIHGFINSLALLILSAFWFNEYKTYPGLMVQKLPFILLKWLLLSILLAGIVLGKKAANKLAAHQG